MPEALFKIRREYGSDLLYIQTSFQTNTKQSGTKFLLKLLAACCVINKEVIFHIILHTFATTVILSNPVPIEPASKMLGHKKLQNTQHYVKILRKRVSDDVQTLRNKFAITDTVVKYEKKGN